MNPNKQKQKSHQMKTDKEKNFVFVYDFFQLTRS